MFSTLSKTEIFDLATSNLSSANAFNLVKPQTLLLNHKCYPPCIRSVLKTLREKEKMFSTLSETEIIDLATSNLSSANAFILVKPQTLLLGRVNLLPYIGSSNSAANKDIMS